MNTWNVQRALRGIATVVFFCTIFTIYSPTVGAEGGSVNWVSESHTPQLIEDSVVNSSEFMAGTCQEQEIKIYFDEEQSYDKEACVVHGLYLQFATTKPYGETYISFNSDQLFYRLDLNGDTYLDNAKSVVIPGSDQIVVVQSNEIKVYFNLSKRVSKAADAPYYAFDTANPKYPAMADQLNRANTWGISRNGRFIVYPKYLGSWCDGYDRLIIFDTQTGVEKFFGEGSRTLCNGESVNVDSVAISNDGLSVVIGSGSKIKAWRIVNCGDNKNIEESQGYEPCPFSLYEPTSYGVNNEFDFIHERYIVGTTFNDNASEMTFFKYSSGAIHRFTIRAPGYESDESEDTLHYLALGDSYTSGEGDIQKKSDGTTYYFAGTNAQGGCHLSERSYPYMLKRYYGIGDNRMRSVACSGAQLVFDYYSPPEAYLGQSKRLSTLSGKLRDEKRVDALREFNPGILPQIEYVKKYKPSVITFTGGGNDVGFADILKYCASPVWEGMFVDDTCGYAVQGSELEKMLYNSIDTQYTYTDSFIKKVKQASSKTRIILVGYPSFIKDDPLISCGLNGGFLDKKERRMINDGLKYINSMLQRVAYENKISFVDIEDSLSGGRICEGSEYVTGVRNLGYTKIAANYLDESFHPNAAGHQMIAKRIQESSAMTSPTVPSLGRYSKPATVLANERRRLLESALIILSEKSNAKLTLSSHSLKPFSPAKVTVYSKQIDLHNVYATSDGALGQEIDVSDVPVGFHVIVVSGLSYSGEPVKYYQFIEVKASNADADGDGILDEDDPCNYIQEWYDEQTGKNVCDTKHDGLTGGIDTKEKLFNTYYQLSQDKSRDIFNESSALAALTLDDRQKHSSVEVSTDGESSWLESKNLVVSIIICGLIGVGIYAIKIKKIRR